MKGYVQMNTLFAAILMIMSAAVFALFASFKMGRTLLEKVTLHWHSDLMFIIRIRICKKLDGFIFSLVSHSVLFRCIRS